MNEYVLYLLIYIRIDQFYKSVKKLAKGLMTSFGSRWLKKILPHHIKKYWGSFGSENVNRRKNVLGNG